MKHNRNIVPSLFTMLNLFFGFFAIVKSVQGKFMTASWLIIIAVVWDSLDGKIARKTNTSSEFGIQFDSIADVVSFGAAPSLLIYQVFFYKLGSAGVILSFFPLLFGAIRLARFNISQDGLGKKNFSGLTIPLMAITLTTYLIFNYDLWEKLKFEPLLIPLVLFLSILMVSNVEYAALPKFSFRENKKNSKLLFLLIIAIVIAVIFQEKSLFPLAFGFVLYYLFRYILSGHKDEDEVFDVYISG